MLADPVRRRIVELLSDGERAAGDVGASVMREFGISQPAVSNQLRALRDAELVTTRAEGSRRLYALAPGGLDEVTAWLERYARFWPQRLDALETELARGVRRRSVGTTASDDSTDDPTEATTGAHS